MRGALLLTSLLVLMPLAATAEPTRDEVMAGATRCAGIADNRAWLDCFYGSAQPRRGLLGLPPAPFSQTKLVPPAGTAYANAAAAPIVAAAPERREKSGGFFSDLIGSTKPLISNVPMASYRFAANGTFTVTLPDGQVFQQDENDTVHARWTKPAASYRVTITAAADKFNLKVKSEPGLVFHVSRK
jgi:hypothetical protein